MSWKDLSIKEKADLMKIYVYNGITKLDDIISHYNTFQAGGYIEKEDPVLKDRRPKANFYQRLLDPNRQTIPDWQHKGNIATHKMSYATNEDNTKAVVYPEVQEINGKLYDFTDPKNKADKWDALNRAIETGDTIQMTPTQAEWWTTHYKDYYPSLKANGGELDNPIDEDPIYKAQPLKPVKISAKRNTIADIQRKRRLLSVEPSKEVILNTNLNKANEFYTSDVVPRLLREHEGLKTKPETSFPEMWKGSIKFDPNIREEAAAYASPFNIVSKTEPRYSRRKPLDEDFIKNMVHENTHVWQYEFPTRDREYKKTSKQLLNDAYIPTGGLKNMYGPLAPLHKHTEQEAVNREIRYKFWSELKNKLGRTPTIDELDDYINKSTDINVLLKFNNGYFKPNTPNTDDYKKTHDAVEKIKQALIHVADNNTPTEANYAANGGSLGKITPYGQWQYPGEVTTIPSNNITMKGVDYPVIGVSNTGDTKLMLPWLNYDFNGDYVTEYPINK